MSGLIFISLSPPSLPHSFTSQNKEDFTQSSVSHTLCHLMKLIQDVTSSDPTNKDILASVLMDKLAPHATELKQWPDDDSLKHTLEWSVAVIIYTLDLEIFSSRIL